MSLLLIAGFAFFVCLAFRPTAIEQAIDPSHGCSAFLLGASRSRPGDPVDTVAVEVPDWTAFVARLEQFDRARVRIIPLEADEVGEFYNSLDDLVLEHANMARFTLYRHRIPVRDSGKASRHFRSSRHPASPENVASNNQADTASSSPDNEEQYRALDGDAGPEDEEAEALEATSYNEELLWSESSRTLSIRTPGFSSWVRERGGPLPVTGPTSFSCAKLQRNWWLPPPDGVEKPMPLRRRRPFSRDASDDASPCYSVDVYVPASAFGLVRLQFAGPEPPQLRYVCAQRAGFGYDCEQRRCVWRSLYDLIEVGDNNEEKCASLLPNELEVSVDGDDRIRLADWPRAPLRRSLQPWTDWAGPVADFRGDGAFDGVLLLFRAPGSGPRAGTARFALYSTSPPAPDAEDRRSGVGPGMRAYDFAEPDLRAIIDDPAEGGHLACEWLFQCGSGACREAFRRQSAASEAPLPHLKKSNTVAGFGTGNQTLRSQYQREYAREIATRRLALMKQAGQGAACCGYHRAPPGHTDDEQLCYGLFGHDPVRPVCDFPLPVDAVYTWVDGSDPAHQAARARYSHETDSLHDGQSNGAAMAAESAGVPLADTLGGDDESLGSVKSSAGISNETDVDSLSRLGRGSTGLLSRRWRSSGELRESIASLYRWAPFVRRIFVITSLRQRPPWPLEPNEILLSEEELDRRRRLRPLDEISSPIDKQRVFIIDDSLIFGQSRKHHLPVFNSQSIESHMHRTPGLSERFIYLCDDMFFGRRMKVNHFFTHIGECRFCVHGGPTTMVRARPDGSTIASDAARRTNIRLLDAAFGFNLDRRYLCHQAKPVRRSMIGFIWQHEVFREHLERTSASRFRSLTDCEPLGLSMQVALERHRAVIADDFDVSATLYVAVTNGVRLAQVSARILVMSPLMYCLNDEHHDPNAQRLQDWQRFMASGLPHRLLSEEDEVALAEGAEPQADILRRSMLRAYTEVQIRPDVHLLRAPLGSDPLKRSNFGPSKPGPQRRLSFGTNKPLVRKYGQDQMHEQEALPKHSASVAAAIRRRTASIVAQNRLREDKE